MARTYEPIASTTLGSDASPSFTSIPGTYTDLVLVMSLRSASNFANRYYGIRVNSDSGNNYSYTHVYGSGSAAGSDRSSNVSRAFSDGIPGSAATANVFATVVVHFMSYANTNVFKTILASVADPQHTDKAATRSVALWRSTNAITSIDISDYGNSASLKSGCVLSLYGIKAA